MQTFADSGLLLILGFTVLPVLYMLPTLVGAARRVDGLALVCPGQPDRRADGCWLARRDDPGVRAEAAPSPATRALAARRLLTGPWSAGLPPGQNVVHWRVSPVRSEVSLTWSWS